MSILHYFEAETLSLCGRFYMSLDIFTAPSHHYITHFLFSWVLFACLSWWV